MHPAYSVILFTTASGLGYGLLWWFAATLLWSGTGSIAWSTGIAALVIGNALVAIGLVSSTFHLGRPERAWRAFSQWQTSWLSREGVLALATFVPSGLALLSWWFGFGRDALPLFALALLVLCPLTVWATGMIYQSLPTIRAWAMPLVAPIYLALAAASGAAAFALLLSATGSGASMSWIAAIALTFAITLKQAYWRQIDRAKRTLTPGDATGLGRFGTVRVLDQPHTTANFIMREMGYDVARRHVVALRHMATVFGFALPILLSLGAIAAVPWLALTCSALAVLLVGFGLLLERWLFFAEAEHVVTLFYGRSAA